LARRITIVELAGRLHFPMICPFRDYVDSGGPGSRRACPTPCRRRAPDPQQGRRARTRCGWKKEGPAPIPPISPSYAHAASSYLCRRCSYRGCSAIVAAKRPSASRGCVMTRPCCLEAEADHRIPDRDRVPRLAAPAVDAAAVEFGGNGAERLTGELLQDRAQHLVALGRRRHQLRIAKLLALGLLGSEWGVSKDGPQGGRPPHSFFLCDCPAPQGGEETHRAYFPTGHTPHSAASFRSSLATHACGFGFRSIQRDSRLEKRSR